MRFSNNHGILKRNITLVIITLLFFNSMILGFFQYNKIKTRLESNSLSIFTVSVENITLIFKDVESNTTLLSRKVNLTEGQTAFDATREALGGIENIIYLPDTGLGVFIRDLKINGTWYEAKSSKFWLYLVNGNLPGVSCSKYGLNSNDTVLWTYTGEMPFGNNGNPDDYLQAFIVIIIILGSIIGGVLILGIIIRKRK